VSLGLAAATTWGGSDFAGGIGARRHPALLVVASGHLVTLLVLLVWSASGHFPPPHPKEFLEGAIGGLEGSLALVLFYRALAMAAMGLTAALTGLLTALVPVLYGVWSEGLPAPLALARSDPGLPGHLARLLFRQTLARSQHPATRSGARSSLRRGLWPATRSPETRSQ